MTSFSYIARTNDGTLERGSIEAASMEKAREALRKQQLSVEEMRAEDEAEPSVSFSQTMPWTVTDEDGVQKKSKKKKSAGSQSYIPLMDTLRLFAGWLLAWYGAVYLLGSLQRSGGILEGWTFIESLFASGTVLRFACATFLFLMFGSIQRWIKGGIGTGIVFWILGIGLFVVFHVNA